LVCWLLVVGLLVVGLLVCWSAGCWLAGCWSVCIASFTPRAHPHGEVLTREAMPGYLFVFEGKEGNTEYVFEDPFLLAFDAAAQLWRSIVHQYDKLDTQHQVSLGGRRGGIADARSSWAVEVVGSHHPYVHRQSERHHWWQRDLASPDGSDQRSYWTQMACQKCSTRRFVPPMASATRTPSALPTPACSRTRHWRLGRHPAVRNISASKEGEGEGHVLKKRTCARPPRRRRWRRRPQTGALP
jgi:hypothetical protein